MKRNYFILILIFSVTQIWGAQSLQDVRAARLRAIDAYDALTLTLQRLHTVSRDYYIEDRFLELFTDSARIYNDILPDNEIQYLFPSEYIAIYADKIESDELMFHSFALIDLPSLQDDGSYIIHCRFNKSETFYTRANYNYPKYSFDYTMTIRINPDTNGAFIESIIPDYPLSEFFVLRKNSQHPIQLNGMEVDEFDRHGFRIFSKDNYDISSFKIENSDRFVRASFVQDTADLHFYSIDEKRMDKLSISAGVGIYGVHNRIGRDLLPFLNEYSNRKQQMSLTFNYGWLLPRIKDKQRTSWFVNLGLSTNLSIYKMTASYSNSMEAIDRDGETYLRHIDVNVPNEQTCHLDVGIPVTIESVIPLSKINNNHFLSIEAGAFINATVMDKIAYDAHASYKGEYNYFGGIVFDHYYDYGDYYLNGQNCKPSFQSNHFNVGGMLGLSYMFGVAGNHLLKVGLLYKQHILAPGKPSSSDYILSYDSEHYQSLFGALKGWQGDLMVQISYCFLRNRHRK